jgi:uncharacterized SAM-binding protein YcdF (DUF218 family)
LIGQCCEAAQLDVVIDPRVPVSQGIRTSDIVKSAVGLLSLGKSNFEAIEPFRHDRFFKEALGLSKTPGSVWMRWLLTTRVPESALARVFYQQQGLHMARVRLEGGSRNTRENAQQVAKLLGERCNQPWLLVTSAWHMPRSLAEFEAVGYRVTPYPVDFWTSDSTPLTEYSLTGSLLRWQTALYEWLGLLVYGLTR